VTAHYLVEAWNLLRNGRGSASQCHGCGPSRSGGASRHEPTTSGPGTVVLFEVAVEVRLLSEAALAQSAAERTLAVVDVPHVTLQVRRYAEAPPAVLAPIEPSH